MSDDPPYPHRRWGCFRTVLQLFVLIAAIGAIGPLAFRAGDEYGYQRGYTLGSRETFTEDQRARTLERHTGVSVRLHTDVEMVLDGLAALDDPDPTPAPAADKTDEDGLKGDTPRPPFEVALDTLVQDLVSEVGRAYPFEVGHEIRALDAWATRRPVWIADQQGALRAWDGRRSPLPDSRVSLSHHARAADLYTRLKDEACPLMRELWTVSANPDHGPPVLPGLCGIVDRELLAPWMQDLQHAALARDVTESVSRSTVRDRKTIMELATAEQRIDGVVRHDYESKLFEGWVFESRDVATLEVRGTGIVKSGFEMHEQYAVAVDTEAQVIRVTLPRAVVLSNTLVPQFAEEREGWWTSLSSKQRNLAIEALQAQVEAKAREAGILDEAESRAQTLVKDLYSPLTALPGSPYTVEVTFEGEREP